MGTGRTRGAYMVSTLAKIPRRGTCPPAAPLAAPPTAQPPAPAPLCAAIDRFEIETWVVLVTERLLGTDHQGMRNWKKKAQDEENLFLQACKMNISEN
jgi:hypothetical protein